MQEFQNLTNDKPPDILSVSQTPSEIKNPVPETPPEPIQPNEISFAGVSPMKNEKQDAEILDADMIMKTGDQKEVAPPKSPNMLSSQKTNKSSKQINFVSPFQIKERVTRMSDNLKEFMKRVVKEPNGMQFTEEVKKINFAQHINDLKKMHLKMGKISKTQANLLSATSEKSNTVSLDFSEDMTLTKTISSFSLSSELSLQKKPSKKEIILKKPSISDNLRKKKLSTYENLNELLFLTYDDTTIQDGDNFHSFFKTSVFSPFFFIQILQADSIPEFPKTWDELSTCNMYEYWNHKQMIYKEPTFDPEFENFATTHKLSVEKALFDFEQKLLKLSIFPFL